MFRLFKIVSKIECNINTVFVFGPVMLNVSKEVMLRNWSNVKTKFRTLITVNFLFYNKIIEVQDAIQIHNYFFIEII